ncbi:WD repeat-containing protein 85 [Elysia marginata]|uniref:WD repeat-containing protein 85 n=1 Tax=Elysia marginata TaxID=1093978 RepID=A0AAV4K2X2_9GAST|nr:WD repeat-containing protein 85 [Elysia marginata]
MDVEVSEVVQKINTGLNADTVEWCPFDGLQHLLLCGTYQLEEQTMSIPEDSSLPQPPNKTEQTRAGGIIIFGLDFRASHQPVLEKLSNLNLCGVLDIKWPDKRLSNTAVFGFVDAEGFCQLFAVDETFSPKEVSKAKLTANSLGLSLGFSDPCNG